MGNIIERVHVAGTTYDIASTAYAVCSNAAIEQKTINIDGFSLVTGVTIHVKFVNANTNPAPALTISGGDSAANNPIPISGITTWTAGAVLTLTYDGSNWVRDYVETVANSITGSGTQNYLTKFSGPNTITNGPALTSSYDSSTAVTTSHKFLREDGTWIVPKYTTNVDTKLRVYLSTTPVELPLVGLNSGNATAAYASHTTGTKDVYGAIPSTVANRATINPSTGAITVPGGLIGNASTATHFATAKTIALTGNVTGSATGGNNDDGWSIATTIATGAVTNDMLAGSIANAKLANDWIKIGNTTKHLGETFSLEDLGIAAAMNFKGTTTTNLTDGDNTSPISIGGEDYTPVNGDVVLNGSKEFVWTGTAWEELGDESSWALSSDVIHISGAKGDIIYWSNTNSPMHLTAGTDGYVLKLANGVPIWAEDSDTKVTQAYSISTSNFPLLFSNTPGIASTDSRGADTALVNNNIYVQPSTGTLHATKFVGDGSGLTNVAASSIEWSAVNNKVFANLYVNDTAAGTNSNAATTNDDTYIHLYDNNTKRDTIQLVGAKGASISATNGVITISSLKYKSSGSANALTSLSLKYTETDGTTQHTETATNAANTATAIGTVANAVLYIKSIYYGTTSVSTGVGIDNTTP